MALSFVLKKVNASTEMSLVLLKYYCNGERVVLSTGLKISALQWNYERQRLKSSAGHQYANELLTDLQKVCADCAKENPGKKLTGDKIRKSVFAFFNPNAESENNESAIPTLYELIQKFISGEIKFRGRDKSPSTLKAYKTSLASLKDFEKKEKFPLTYETITLDMYYKYIAYMKRKKYKQNTVAKRLRSLKAYMGEAVDLHYTTNEQFRSKKFSAPETEVDSVYLTEKEIIELYNFDTSSNPGLDRVKDLFVFGACTGLRYSDYSQIKPENIINSDGDTLLQIQTRKTNSLVVIPCNPIVLEIFEKYKANANRLPKSISGAKFNFYLKNVAKLVPGFDQTGRLLSEPTKPLYACLTSHTARRSAITNWHNSGFSTIDLMAISGHKTPSAFLRYVKTTKVQIAKRLQTHIKKNWTPNLLKAI